MKFDYISVGGATHYEIGLSYGRQARNKINIAIANYRSYFSRRSPLSWQQLREYAFRYTETLKETVPELIDEVKGIAEGSGNDFGDIMVLNCRYEITKQPGVKECTTAAVLPDAAGGKTYLVKNWDYRAGILEHIIVLHIHQPDGTRILGLTEAGQLIREGFNNYGVGLCNNALKSTFDKGGEGIPATFLRRKVLTSKNFEEARKLLESSKRSVSNNMLLVSADGDAIDLEASPNGYDLLLPENGLLTHANHFEINTEINVWSITKRSDRLRQLLEQKNGSIDVEHIKACMTDHENAPESICRHPEDINETLDDREITVANMIIDFQNATAHICAGPPCVGEYFEYRI